MKIGYFPGCSLHGTAVEYQESLFEVCKKFDIELIEIKDWNCCGATAAHSLNKLLSLALATRTLALAEKQGFDEIVIPCAACFNRLATAYQELQHDKMMREKISEVIEMEFTAKSKPMNLIDFINKYINDKLAGLVTTPFEKIAACYYGCLLVRPKEIANCERYEDPLMMEDIMKKIGGKSIDWAFKTECCGAGLSVSKTDIVGKLSGNILEDAVSRGAEVIITACPMCQSNLDMRRKNINLFLGKKVDVPVLFITQAIGMALGIDNKKLGLHRHIVNTDILFSNHPANNTVQLAGKEA
jgi:heterodisulfide reductase subunit B2